MLLLLALELLLLEHLGIDRHALLPAISADELRAQSDRTLWHAKGGHRAQHTLTHSSFCAFSFTMTLQRRHCERAARPFSLHLKPVDSVLHHLNIFISMFSHQFCIQQPSWLQKHTQHQMKSVFFRVSVTHLFQLSCPLFSHHLILKMLKTIKSALVLTLSSLTCPFELWVCLFDGFPAPWRTASLRTVFMSSRGMCMPSATLHVSPEVLHSSSAVCLAR
jgi:hypothetical protein